MAGLKISQLNALTNAEIAAGDLIPITDSSEFETKNISIAELDLRYKAPAEALIDDIEDHETRIAYIEGNYLELDSVNNASLTGSDQDLPYTGKSVVRLTNAGLVSIANSSTLGNKKSIILINDTTVAITIKNNANIVTGTELDLEVPSTGVIFLYKDSLSGKIRIIGGAGGGGGTTKYAELLTLASNAQITVTEKDLNQTFLVASSGGPVDLNVLPFNNTAVVNNKIITLIGSSDDDYPIVKRNPAAKGCLQNGDMALTKGRSITYRFNTTLNNYVEISRS